MKTSGLVYKCKDEFIAVKTDSKTWKVGDKVSIRRGPERSLSQNSLYWIFLRWLIEHGLREQGHFCPEALHLDLKQHFLAEKVMSKAQFRAIEEASTSELNKIEFSEYMEKIDMFMVEFFELDTSAFWATHGKEHGNEGNPNII